MRPLKIKMLAKLFTEGTSTVCCALIGGSSNATRLWGSHHPFHINSNKRYFNQYVMSLSAFLTVIITSSCTSALQLANKPVKSSLYLPVFFSPQHFYKYIQELKEQKTI